MDDTIDKFTLVLKLGGIWWKSGNSIYDRAIALFNMYRLLNLIVVMFFCIRWIILDPTANFFQFSMVATMATSIIGQTIIFLLNKPAADELIDTLKSISKKGLTEKGKEILNEEIGKGWTIFKHHSYSMGNLYTVGLIFPGITSVVDWLTGWGRISSFPLPLDPYFSFEYRPLILTIIVYLSNITVSSLGVLSNMSTIGVMMMTASINISSLRIVKEEVKMLAESKGDWDLREVVRKHCNCIRLNKAVNKYGGSAFAFQNTFYSMIICLTLYNIIWFSKISTLVTAIDLGYLIKVSAIMMLVMHMGERVKSESEDLFHEVCRAPWYNQPNRIAKEYLIVMRLAQKPMVMDYKGLGTLSHDTGLQIFNAAYSYFMLIQNS